MDPEPWSLWQTWAAPLWLSWSSWRSPTWRRCCCPGAGCLSSRCPPCLWKAETCAATKDKHCKQGQQICLIWNAMCCVIACFVKPFKQVHVEQSINTQILSWKNRSLTSGNHTWQLHEVSTNRVHLSPTTMSSIPLMLCNWPLGSKFNAEICSTQIHLRVHVIV